MIKFKSLGVCCSRHNKADLNPEQFSRCTQSPPARTSPFFIPKSHTQLDLKVFSLASKVKQAVRNRLFCHLFSYLPSVAPLWSPKAAHCKSAKGARTENQEETKGEEARLHRSLFRCQGGQQAAWQPIPPSLSLSLSPSSRILFSK